MPALDAFSHISLTVTDPERSADFYNRVLGTETVFSTDGAGGRLLIVARPGMMIALRDHPEANDKSFDPGRIGLDHVAFLVPSRARAGSLADQPDRRRGGLFDHRGESVRAAPEPERSRRHRRRAVRLATGLSRTHQPTGA